MGHAALVLLAAALAATAASCPSGGTALAEGAGEGAGAAACRCDEGGTRLECRGAGLNRLPPLHESLISL